VCCVLGQFGADLGEGVSSRWICDGCVCVGVWCVGVWGVCVCVCVCVGVWCVVVSEISDWYFKKSSLASRRYTWIFVIYDLK